MSDKSAGRFAESEQLDLSPLPGFIGYALRRAHVAVFQDFHATFAPLDLRPSQFGVLAVIGRNPGLRQNQVAEALGIQPPNFAVMLNALVASGYITRLESPTDRRAIALHLTESGEALLGRAMELLAQHEERLTARLGTERRQQLLDMLRDLRG